MSKLRFELNRKGVRELLHSPEMVSVLEGYGRTIADNAGEGFEVKHMPTRAIAVETGTDAAARDNLEHNTLLKAVRR
ncbi:MAG: hypothetical protein IJY32_03875 [Mogibacterium sp.]|nr:hypothetical protein [Mogibacterium sp.]